MREKELKFMEWAECEQKHMRRVEKDTEKIKSIIRICSKRLAFIRTNVVNDETASFIVENYYEVIKELLVALLLKNGLKSDNHQCLITYFYRNYEQYEYEAHLILRMSYLRNRLNYYGEPINIEFYNKYQKDFESVIEKIQKIIGEK